VFSCPLKRRVRPRGDTPAFCNQRVDHDLRLYNSVDVKLRDDYERGVVVLLVLDFSYPERLAEDILQGADKGVLGRVRCSRVHAPL